MVTAFSWAAHRTPNYFLGWQETIVLCWQENDTSKGRKITTDVREAICKSFVLRGCSIPGSQIMLQSLSESTVKQYATSLSWWKDFCIAYEFEFYNPKLDDFQNFLTEAFVEGASYGIINTLRCAVFLISQQKLGDHPAISRFMKGIFWVRPLKPKYQGTWDTSVVIRYIKKLYPLEKLALTELSERTAILLALSTGQRAQTLSKINIGWLTDYYYRQD